MIRKLITLLFIGKPKNGERMPPPKVRTYEVNKPESFNEWVKILKH